MNSIVSRLLPLLWLLPLLIREEKIHSLSLSYRRLIETQVERRGKNRKKL